MGGKGTHGLHITCASACIMVATPAASDCEVYAIDLCVKSI